jgi:Tol biopolymer transport system component
LWVLKRASKDDNWGPPENLGPAVNSPNLDELPFIAPDGLTLYFDTDKPDGYGSFDIYMTTRATKDSPWATPVNLGPKINTSSDEGDPWISPDGLELYFHSYKSGGHGQSDIYVTRRATQNDPWGAPVNLDLVVNSPFREQFLSLSPDGLLLLFSDFPGQSPRPGGYGGSDIWITKRASLSAPWQTPMNLGPRVNTSAHEFAPRISPDGGMLYFGRGNGSWDNWQTPILPVVDFNGDGIVDCVDICMLVDHLDTNEPLYDIAPVPLGDGVVDVQDLIVLTEHLTKKQVDPNALTP